MAIRIPDTLNIENSEKYKVSIRLWSGGLSFSGYMPSVPGSFFYKEEEISGNSPFIDSFKDIFYSHEFFTWMYKEINVVFESPQYTLVPKILFQEEKAEEFLKFNFMQAQTYTLFDEISTQQAVMVYGIENNVYEFCARSFINPRFIHYLTPQLKYYVQLSKATTSRDMYVALHPKMIDITIMYRERLVFTNSFHVDQPEDILYIILYVWKQVSLDQSKDQLLIFGEGEKRSNLVELLSKYLKHISPVEIPSEAYLLGNEMVHTPMDIIALTICG